MLPTGLVSIDSVAKIQPGDLWVHGSTPGEMSLSFALNWAHETLLNGKKVLFLGTSLAFVWGRLSEIHAACGYFDRSLQDLEFVCSALPICPRDMNEVRLEIQSYQPDFVVVCDYSRVQKDTIRHVKDIALDCHVPILALAYIGRSARERAEQNDGAYQLSDLLESQVADIVTATYLDEELRQYQMTIVSNLKNRSGSLFDAFETSVEIGNSCLFSERWNVQTKRQRV